MHAHTDGHVTWRPRVCSRRLNVERCRLLWNPLFSVCPPRGLVVRLSNGCGGCGGCDLNVMELSMRLRKVRPQCNAIVHVKRSVCGCGHAFALKRKAQYTSDKEKVKVMKRRRALESEEETLMRKEKDKLHKLSKRVCETREQILHRQEQDRVRKVSMRASETCEQTLHRQEQDRVRKVSMSAG